MSDDKKIDEALDKKNWRNCGADYGGNSSSGSSNCSDWKEGRGSKQEKWKYV